jgi:DUF4097 and DUF4098 domain-containing protein YvlB
VDTKEDIIFSVTDEAFLESLKLKLDSDNLTVTDAAIAKVIDAQMIVNSGSLNINNFKSDQLDIVMDSGNFTGHIVTADITASVNSGNIKLENTTGRSSLSVDSGNIRLYKLDNSNAEISANSGNVYIQVPSSFAGFYDLQADSGTIHSPESKRKSKDYIKVRTDSGNIKIEQK